MNINKKDKERFLSKVDKSDLSDDCWEWNAAMDKDGYGNFYAQKKYVKAHRFAYLLYYGIDPRHSWVLHTCDNHSCVNPNHLRLSGQGCQKHINIEIVKKRFWEKVQKFNGAECWPWLGGAVPRGYGLFRFKGRKQGAHRLAYFFHYGVDPGKLYVCHHCDNPNCCNPNHLFLGTHSDNMRDMITKGRGVYRKGTNNPSAKLTEEAVVVIRQSNETYTILAERYGVTLCAIKDAAVGKTWKHVKTPTKRRMLMPRQVKEIRVSFNTIKELMKLYSVSEGVIKDILSYKTWKNVD